MQVRWVPVTLQKRNYRVPAGVELDSPAITRVMILTESQSITRRSVDRKSAIENQTSSSSNYKQRNDEISAA